MVFLLLVVSRHTRRSGRTTSSRTRAIPNNLVGICQILIIIVKRDIVLFDVND
jgi:hypothetical protein